MANVEFPDYMKGVSGTLRSITLNDGTKRKVIVTCSKSGKQRMYLRDYKPRTSKISKNELAARSRFAMISEQIKNLSDEQKKDYQQQWRKNKYMFNGKKYATLRGYVMARLYAEQ